MLNKDSTTGGFNPKHRMIGAVVLVIVAVIVVPLVLNRRTPPETAPSAQTPATQTIVVPVTPEETRSEIPDTASRSEPAPAPAPTPPLDTGAPPSVNTPPPQPKASAPLAAATRIKPSTATKGWFVQAGTFSNPENARQLVERLKKKGFNAASESLQVEKNTVVRVRIGPYANAAQAQKAHAALRRATAIKGIVRHY